ncbi:Caudovirales tail fiber assembly protein [compost metagenome]
MSNIDWNKLVTQAMKDAALHAQQVELSTAEVLRLRKIADQAVSDLQDAVDIDEASADEIAQLEAWKKYRVALNRLPEQVGYPTVIDWPVVPI